MNPVEQTQIQPLGRLQLPDETPRLGVEKDVSVALQPHQPLQAFRD